MTTLDYEVNLAYNRQRVAEIRDSVRAMDESVRPQSVVRPLSRFRIALGGALIAAGQQVCGSTIRCQVPQHTVIGRASS
jgi:hypothetical protein